MTDRPRHKPLTQAIEDALADPSVQRAVNWMMTHPPGAKLPEELEPRLGHGACKIDPDTGLHLAWCVADEADL